MHSALALKSSILAGVCQDPASELFRIQQNRSQTLPMSSEF